MDMSWHTLNAGLISPRNSHATCAANNKIYVINGYDNLLSTELNTMEVFDLATCRWSSLTGPSEAASEVCAVSNGTSIFLFGNSGTANYQKYNIATGVWSNITNPPNKTDNPSCCWDGNNTIYLIGGYSGAGYKRYTYAYTIDTNGFSTKAVLPPSSGRGWGTCQYYGGKVYYIGGEDTTAARANVYEFDCAGNTWTTKTPMPAARVSLASVIVGSKIYVLGGKDAAGAEQASVFIYDIPTDSWSIARQQMPVERCSLGAAYVGGKIFAVGGNDFAGTDLGEVHFYQFTDFQGYACG